MMNWSRSGKHFNSRPHGGRRKTGFSVSNSAGNFNSRPHGGRHTALLGDDKVLVISTHALTEGDFGLPDEVPFDYISTHALTEGDILSTAYCASSAVHFNSRPHGGRRQI